MENLIFLLTNIIFTGYIILICFYIDSHGGITSIRERMSGNVNLFLLNPFNRFLVIVIFHILLSLLFNLSTIAHCVPSQHPPYMMKPQYGLDPQPEILEGAGAGVIAALAKKPARIVAFIPASLIPIRTPIVLHLPVFDGNQFVTTGLNDLTNYPIIKPQTLHGIHGMSIHQYMLQLADAYHSRKGGFDAYVYEDNAYLTLMNIMKVYFSSTTEKEFFFRVVKLLHSNSDMATLWAENIYEFYNVYNFPNRFINDLLIQCYKDDTDEMSRIAYNNIISAIRVYNYIEYKHSMTINYEGNIGAMHKEFDSFNVAKRYYGHFHYVAIVRCCDLVVFHSAIRPLVYLALKYTSSGGSVMVPEDFMPNSSQFTNLPTAGPYNNPEEHIFSLFS